MRRRSSTSIQNNASEELIIEMAKVDQGVIDAVKKDMEEEVKVKQRLAEEEAARKKARGGRACPRRHPVRMKYSITSNPFAKSWNSAIRRRR